MSRSETKACLFAMGRASLRVSHHTRAIRELEVQLSIYPAAPVPAPRSASGDVYAVNDSILIKEGKNVVLPHGNVTTDITLQTVLRRDDIQQRINALVAEMDVCSGYYFAMVKALSDYLPREQAVLLHTYYCNPCRYTRQAMITKSNVRESEFYRRLRDAVTAFQMFSLPEIPDELKED